MGQSKHTIEWIEAHLDRTLGHRMLELGNQTLRGGGSAKSYWTALGVQHVSADRNGRDGAVTVDLRTPGLRPDWSGVFDSVTNCGTIEHVTPIRCQPAIWDSVYRWLAPRGQAFHVAPTRCSRWRRHCRIFYSVAFFEWLAQRQHLDLVDAYIRRGLVFAVLQKKPATEPAAISADELRSQVDN